MAGAASFLFEEPNSIDFQRLVDINMLIRLLQANFLNQQMSNCFLFSLDTYSYVLDMSVVVFIMNPA